MTVSQNIIPDGVYTPITTFFHNDYSLDLETQVQHAKNLYQGGITGLVVAGSMGEGGHMTKKERFELVKALKQGVPELTLIAGAPAMGSIAEAIEETESHKAAGADFLILLPPAYFGPHLTSQEGLIEYFTAVADKSALPIMIYNYPGNCNNVTFTIDTFKVLAKHQNIAGVKLTHFNLDLYTLLGKDVTLYNQGFRVFTGLGQVLVPALSVGLSGTIDGLSGIFPKTMVKLYTLFREGNIKEASDLQFLVTTADQMLADLNLVGAKVAIQKYQGLGELLTGRPPLSKGVGKGYAKYEEYLDAIDTIEKGLP